MTSIDLTGLKLHQIITHHVGNQSRDESYRLSHETSEIEEETVDYVLQYFLQTLKTEEMYRFDHPVRTELNATYAVVREVFQDQSQFIETSQQIARLLYENSLHPNIKEGELNVAYFTDAIFNNERVDAIGIFKSETTVPYLKMDARDTQYKIHHDFGFELKKIDKGCLILNAEADSGYKVFVADSASGSGEAVYWKNDFLDVKPTSNEFHQTKEFLGIAKNYLTSQFEEEFDIEKTDKIDMLNRSIDYFKSHDNFNKLEFEAEVFQDPQVIESFRSFDANYRDENDLELSDDFEISNLAVKRQARVFKSVLKLDKNFHVYIHGNRELIEKGTDPDGRKYYKIYYDNES